MTIGADPGAAPTVAAAEAFSVKSQAKNTARRERTRSFIAYALVFLLALTGAAWVLVGINTSESPADASLDKIFVGLLGLTGTVVGFYFGSASEEKRPSQENTADSGQGGPSASHPPPTSR